MCVCVMCVCVLGIIVHLMLLVSFTPSLLLNEVIKVSVVKGCRGERKRTALHLFFSRSFKEPFT